MQCDLDSSLSKIKTLLNDFYSIDFSEEIEYHGDLTSIIEELDNFGCNYLNIYNGLPDNLI